MPAPADRRCHRAGFEPGGRRPIALRRGLATPQGMRERSPVEKARIARSEPDRHVERHDPFARRLVAMEPQTRALSPAMKPSGRPEKARASAGRRLSPFAPSTASLVPRGIQTGAEYWSE